MAAQPCEIGLGVLRRRHHPEGFPPGPEAPAAKKSPEQPQAGDPPNALAGAQEPKEHHIAAVGDREIRILQRLAVGRVIREADHDRRRRHHDKAARVHKF